MAMTDALRGYVTALRDLPSGVAGEFADVRSTPAATSPMQAAIETMHPRGQLAVDLIIDARDRAVAGVEACGEHVLATARLLEKPERFYSGQVVARAGVEAAGLVRWLLDPNASPEEVIARHLGRARDEQDRGIKFLTSASVSDPVDQEELATISQHIVEMKDRTVAAIEEIGIKPVRLGSTELAKYGGDPEEYDIFSGSMHGRLAPFLETQKMAADDVGSAILFMNLISVTARAYVTAIDVARTFVTGQHLSDARLAEVAEALGLNEDALTPPDMPSSRLD